MQIRGVFPFFFEVEKTFKKMNNGLVFPLLLLFPCGTLPSVQASGCWKCWKWDVQSQLMSGDIQTRRF